MSGPPTTPGPASPGPVPPYPGPYAPYYPAPPRRRDNLALIIVLIVVLVVAVSTAMAAILYIMVSRLITGPSPQPIVLFGSVEMTAGNATIRIVAVSGTVSSDNLQMLLRANDSANSPVRLPPPNGSVAIVAGSYSLRVFLLDDNSDGRFGLGDSFWITGNLAPLPRATTLTFVLRSLTGVVVAETTWSTP